MAGYSYKGHNYITSAECWQNCGRFTQYFFEEDLEFYDKDCSERVVQMNYSDYTTSFEEQYKCRRTFEDWEVTQTMTIYSYGHNCIGP